ncbi:MAG: methionyl-tRNA formyltransferase, partial [Bacilli bacterium]|nr:methionyl-tRNA formyltransferase [Bacilli bacterium]
MKNLKVVFMGTPTFSVPILESLIKETNVILVVSQPDREKDRKGNLLPTPIKVLAETNNIEVFQPQKIKEEYNKIIDLNPDIIITCAYGQIIPEVILNNPKYGCINVHGSLLPSYRGGAPIHHAIIDGC